jgi:hypothetical protein
MLADYCLSFIRETPAGETKRQKKAKCVFNEIFLVRMPHIEKLFIIQDCIL